MVRRNFRILMVVIAASALAACSDRSPVAPPGPDFAAHMARVVPVPGSYELSFLSNGQPVSSLPVCQGLVCPELILKAHVAYASSGAPAQGGSVTFQYCSRNGPSNDIDRADEAPMAECESGAASWSRLRTRDVDANGDAFMNFGFVSRPRTIGFRFKYSARRSGLADGLSAPRDFTWTSS